MRVGSIPVSWTKLFKQAVQNQFYFLAVLGVGFVFLLSFWILFFLPQGRAIQLLGSFSLYIHVLKPLLLFGIILCSFGLLLLIMTRTGLNAQILRNDKGIIRLSIAIFAGLLAIVGLIAFSGIGLGFDASVWNAPGTPILISQVIIVLVAALLSLIVISWLVRRIRKRSLSEKLSRGLLDLSIAIVIWILAGGFWLAQAAPSTYYDTPPQAPNFQPYPLSDAFNHDVIANNVLIGEGFHFGGQVATRRPVYTLFLAGLEELFGGNYDSVIAVQVIALALFPAFLYLLGSKMHSRLAGFLVAGFIIFREANSIVLGDVINTSHAKLLMADLPTALIVAGIALAAFTWLSRGHWESISPLLVGGLLGWAILLRSQSLTLLPFLILLAVLIWGLRKAWKPVLLFVLGVGLVASPWILRNRVLMGQWAIEDAVVSGFLANRYSFTPGTFGLPFLHGESEGEYYARQMAHVRDFTLANPGYVAGFVADNFVRNQLLNFLVTPLSWELRDLESHVRELPYWPGWQGHVDPETYLPMTINLLLISIGIGVAWKKFRWMGLLPLFINLGFTLNLALARVSGWRYNLPVDWTVLLYFAIGISQILLWVFLLTQKRATTSTLLAISSNNDNVNLSSNKANRVRKNKYLPAIALALLFLGSSFLLIEGLSHPRYSRLNAQDASVEISIAQLRGSAIEGDRDKLINLLSTGKARVINGRALYPRYYRANEGEPGRNFVLIDPMDFERVSFFVIGPDPASVILRVDNPRLDFPGSSDVVIVHCDNTLDAAAVIVKNREGRANLYISTDLAASCPE